MNSSEEEYRNLYNQGATKNAIIVQMLQDGVHILEAIKISRGIFSIPFGEAKVMVSSHPLYRAQQEQHGLSGERVDELLQELAKDDTIEIK